MIIYIRQAVKVNFLHRMFNIIKTENVENKTIFTIPINKKSTKWKTKHVMEKLGKYLYDNNIKDVALEQALMENEEAKNILYSYNINILSGAELSKFLIHNVLKKIYQYKNSKIETSEITILVNENTDINIHNIKLIAQNVKRLNIIANNIKKFRRVVEYLYKEYGILIKLSNNMKTNIKSSEIIINIDFPEEILNKLDIPNNAIVINIPKNINITSKRFTGVNVKSWNIKIPNKYKVEGFQDKIIYESLIYKKPIIKVFNQIENDHIEIEELIGLNGAIDKREFI